LPGSQVPEIAADIVLPVSIEELDTPVATLFAEPLAAHVAGQAVELAVETGCGVWSEAPEPSPDVVALDRAAIDGATIVTGSRRGV
jgi:hypothetical protein